MQIKNKYGEARQNRIIVGGGNQNNVNHMKYHRAKSF